MSRLTAFLACSVLVTSTYAQAILPSAEPFPAGPGMAQEGETATITPAPMVTMMPEGFAPGLEPSAMPTFPGVGTMETGLESEVEGTPMDDFMTSEPDMMTATDDEPTGPGNSFNTEPDFMTNPSNMGQEPAVEPNTGTEPFPVGSENTFEPVAEVNSNGETGMMTGEGMNTFEPPTGVNTNEETGMTGEGMNTFEPTTGGNNNEETGMSGEGMTTFEPTSGGRASPPTNSESGKEGLGEKMPCEIGETVKMACMTRCEMMKTAEMCMKRCSLIGRTVCFMIELKDY